MKKLFIYAIIILLIVVGVFFIERNYTRESAVYTIQLRENGFSPQELTIQKGDTVKFVSESRIFWPASNLHPSHAIYSEFDPKEPIETEESWSFRFNKPGEWKYHDHLAPYFTGTIIVGEKNKVSGNTTKDECFRLHSSVYCWQEELFAVLKQEGLNATFDRLAIIYNRDKVFRDSCHQLTHNIGIASYADYLKDKDSVLTPRASVCGNGFYHGFMEAFLSTNLNPGEAREFCKYVDKKLTSQAPDAALQCYHGIGHGAMDIAIISGSKGENEKDFIEPALEICREASDTEDQLYRCASGVFNGIANFYIEGEFGLSINEEDPLWLCHDQSEEFKLSCYGNMNSALYWYSNNDFSKAVRYVESINDEIQAISAVRYLAALASIYEGKDVSTVVTDCRLLQDSLHLSCIQGFAHGFLEHGTPGIEYEDALNFCRSDKLTQEEKDVCFRYALDLGGWYPEEKIGEICSGVEEEYKEYCK